MIAFIILLLRPNLYLFIIYLSYTETKFPFSSVPISKTLLHDTWTKLITTNIKGNIQTYPQKPP